MKVVILARNPVEGRTFAQLSGMTPNTGAIIISGVHDILGFKLEEGDLVAEFEGFRERIDWQEIVNTLRRTFVASGPRWERIGKPRPLV